MCRSALPLGVLLERDRAVVAALGVVRRCGRGRRTRVGRGQIVLVANPGLVTSIRDEDHPDGMTYIHPRSHDVVLGGTFQPGDWNDTPDPATTEAILRRCAGLVPELADARPRREAAGLRPARHGGPRVEPAQAPLPRGTRVIHNYGHGGAGVTLSWGCADEVARLAS